MNSTETSRVIQELIDLGWLFDVELKNGALKAYALTFSLIPLGEMRT
ncbi:hypothetical protein SEA_WEASELS2_60 [Rhodococcus phage Weasels2]|uniref:Uncharacterized protein n=1 Tax=Rhodococcus phage Weasels2 TaxID=1897437 RepID=A0A1I9SA43_9CAUD|nr:hypothetical protein FDH04_gp060 [Rhodococcus phage Weasels2]AOZ63649.1 hypothetical protein SEA_WEASELS2_60 [Rhodococcus phage Weasels2]